MDTDALIAASERARLIGQHLQGDELATQALTRAGATPLQQASAGALVAIHALRLGFHERALQAGERALELFMAANERAEQAKVRSTLAVIYLDVYLPQHALSHAVASIEAARSCGDRQAESWALNRAAAVHQELGDLEKAVDMGRRALTLAQSIADDDATFAAMINLGTSELNLAAKDAKRGLDPRPTQAQALRHMEESIEKYAEGNAHREGFARLRLVRALKQVRRVGEAQAQLAMVLALAAQNGFRPLLLEANLLQGQLLAAQGKSQAATDRLETLLADIEVNKDPRIRFQFHEALYDLHKRAGAFEPALVHHEALHNFKLQQMEQTASLQSRILLNRVELDEARHQAERARLDAEMQRMRAEALDREAHTDALTGLLNRRFLDRQLPRLMDRAQELAAPLVGASIDIDHFKLVNDTHGHAVGDRVLVELAMLLRQSTRGSDLALRLGGEEFLLVLPDTPPERCTEVCERLRLRVQNHDWDSLVPGLSCTISIGLGALLPAEDTAGWMRRLDTALYAAKHQGRNRVIIADTTPLPERRSA